MARSALLSRWSHQVEVTWSSSSETRICLVMAIRQVWPSIIWGKYITFDVWKTDAYRVFLWSALEPTGSKCLNLPVQNVWTYRFKVSELTGSKRLNLPVHSLITYLVKGSSCTCPELHHVPGQRVITYLSWNSSRTYPEAHHLLVLRLITDE